jgi:replication factor C subunit 3/5
VTRHRLSTGGNEKIQLSALLAAFKNAVELSVSAGSEAT